MKEGISTKVARIISGTFNNAIKHIEGKMPEVMMNEAIDEINGVVHDVRSELGKIVASIYTTQKQMNANQSKHDALNSQISVALKAGREDLAEVAASKQMDIEDQKPVIKKAMENQQAKAKELNDYIKALLAKQRDMTDELQQFKDANTEAKSAVQDTDTLSTVDLRVEGASNAFRRAASINIIHIGTDSSMSDQRKLAELNELTRKHRIEERIASIKADVNPNESD